MPTTHARNRDFQMPAWSIWMLEVKRWILTKKFLVIQLIFLFVLSTKKKKSIKNLLLCKFYLVVEIKVFFFASWVIKVSEESCGDVRKRFVKHFGEFLKELKEKLMKKMSWVSVRWYRRSMAWKMGGKW